MNILRGGLPLEAFSVRSFRFQWPADLLAYWAFEMEALILGWYILTTTNSIISLTILGGMRYIGTLLSPWFGVGSDRWGRRRILIGMRLVMSVFAAIIMTLSLVNELNYYYVFFIAFCSGLVQPSDTAIRTSLIGDSIPKKMLMGATSFSRISQDAARIFGALLGAGLFSILGMGVSYIFVVGIYCLSVLLTFGVSKAHPRVDSVQPLDVTLKEVSWFADFKRGLIYIWNFPSVLMIVLLAFLANLTAFPMTHGLMPFVAKDVLLVDENGLGQLLAMFSFGAVIGSVLLIVTPSQQYSKWLMLINLLMWYLTLMVFAYSETLLEALIILFFVGVAHSLAMTSMSVFLLEITDPIMRGRIMGIRVLAIYGVPLGLLGAGFLINHLGFIGFTGIYVTIGALLTICIGARWYQVEVK